MRQQTTKAKTGTLHIILYKNDQHHIQPEMVDVDFGGNADVDNQLGGNYEEDLYDSVSVESTGAVSNNDNDN